MVQVGVVVMFSITRTTYNAVSVHGSRRPRYNGAAVYVKFLTPINFKLPPGVRLGEFIIETSTTYIRY